ncbi:MAG: sulfatase-like hydrolase/transferase [Verrucomicrobiae bacterium]|nr:sulfatase-like hydrolase/transferase [Verrucomicrobiae bacterium]
MRTFLLLFLCVSAAPRETFSSEAPRPNILFLFADDWGWGDLSCHGHPYVKTPNLDRLAREGTDFQRFTVASGVCSPSRTAVMTGHFPARYHIDGHFAWVPQNEKRDMPDWLDPKAPTLPKMLQAAGYRTAHYGKWHLSNDMIPDSPTPAAYGYDDYGAFNCSGEQMPVHEDAQHAISFMEDSVKRKTPFFINVWLHEPHTPFHTVPKYEWRFRDMESRADQIYASVLSHADDRIGQMLDALDRLGITQNTLVIFSSDNGPARGSGKEELELQYDTATGAGWGIAASKGITGGRRGYKASLFEGGIGVPFIARWPGVIEAGKIDDTSLISAVDLLPTFCEVAGAKPPADYMPDGVSVVEVLKGQSMPQRDKPLFWKIDAPWPAKGKPDHWVAWAVVHDHWKLVANNDLTHTELYDIATDVSESSNVSADHPEVAADLLTKLKQWQATLPDEPTGEVFSKLRKEER